MNRESTHTHVTGIVALLGALGLLVTSLANAQVPVDDEGNPVGSVGSADYPATSADSEGPILSAAELETLVGPVALYPDDLLAIVLPASTYPLEIVQAARFLERHEDDPALTPDDDWDESIIALLNYPEVVNMMNDDLDWTWKLGEAVVAQQSDLIAAVEAFRDRAYAAGNLKTDEHQTVSYDDGIIEIEPVSEDVIYVPYYEPKRVVVYSPRPAYYYYPRPYPVYDYPYAPGYDFGSGFFWGVTTAFTIGWASDYLHVYHNSYYGHPYYGRTYYGNHYWRNPSIYLYNNYYVNNHHHHRGSHDHYRDGDYWRPRHHGGARPGHRSVHNTYYSGGQRSNRGDRSFRDDRTDGLAFSSRGRSSSHSSRGEHRGSDRHGNRGPTVQFRPRGNNAFTGTIAPRLERAPDDASRRSHHRSNDDHRSNGNHGANNRSSHGRHGSHNSSDDGIRFRARESGTRRSDANRRTVARQTRRPDRSAAVSQRRRTSLAANNSSRTVRNTTRRPASASRATNVRRTARASSPPRQAAVRSQPRRESQARPARPRQTQRADSSRHGSSSRPSSERKSVARSDETRRSSRGSQGRKRSGRGRR